MRFAVEPWSPDFDAPVDLPDAEPTAEVDIAVELAADSWRAIAPPPAAQVDSVVFVDGVQRIDARIWAQHDGNGSGQSVSPGICASVASGAVRCAELAEVEDCEVRRVYISPSPEGAIPVSVDDHYQPRAVTEGTTQHLRNGLSEALRDIEVEISRRVATADLMVVDGPLWGRSELDHAVGYLKTHHVTYLPAELQALVPTLAPGQRTPVFLVETSWSRYTWYARLPVDDALLPDVAVAHWTAMVRMEAAASRSVKEARQLADLATALAPRFASARHKEPRAPQNLYPIAGLERELRRRLGERDLLYRRICVAARG